MHQQPRLPLWFLFANWLMVLLALAVGWFLGSRRYAEMPEPQRSALDLVYRTILEAHVDPPKGDELLDKALAAMAAVDEYSRYVGPRELADYEEHSTGRYEGVGFYVAQHGDDLVVHFPFPGGPAERAGIRPGDRLVGVDDTPLRTIPRESRQARAAELVRGPAGTSVRLRVERDDGEHELTAERADVRELATTWPHFADRDTGLAYVHVTHFPIGVADDLRAALAALQKERSLRGLVLDLRGNRGGNLAECVAITNLFLQQGTILSQRRRDQEVVETFSAHPDKCLFPDLPLVVLVDGASASASEVVAGALQDHHRAAIVGVRTYGKGFVNAEYTWRNLPFRLKLTTALFYTPNGRNIDRHRTKEGNGDSVKNGGIPPDVECAVDAATQQRIRAALAALESPAAYREALAAVAAKYGFSMAAPPAADQDPQLAAALETLRERSADGPPPRTETQGK